MQASEALVAGAHSRLRRLDLRVAVGLLLMLVAVLGGASLIRSAQDRIPVLVAAGSVQPGEVIGPSDLRVVEMSVPAGVAYLSASAEGQIEGRVAAEPLWDGKVLGPGSVAEAPPVAAGMVAITLLLPPESAVGGDIRSGDRVAVLSSRGVDEAGGNQQEAATTILLLRELLGHTRDRAEEAAGRSPSILYGIRAVALVEGYDVKRERLLHDLVAQAGYYTYQFLDDVFIEEDDDE
jgi:Flp pilus assembly protein CpaB